MARGGHASRSLVASSTSYPFAFLEVVESSGPPASAHSVVSCVFG